MAAVIEEFTTNESIESMTQWTNEQPEMQLYLRICSSIGIGKDMLTSDELIYLHSIAHRISNILEIKWKNRHG
jgi:hypothetical protein